MNPDQPSRTSFDAVEQVVADPLRFKLRLGVGEDAYRSLRLKKTLQQFWDIGGMAATGAGVAASPVVASTLFASTASGSFLPLIGLGTAAVTPIGWIVAAAAASGGAYYGVTRLFRGAVGTMTDTIPKFINTPIDLLAASLFDLVGALAVRVAMIDGHLAEAERTLIARQFVADWGLDATYVDKAIEVIVAGDGRQRVKQLAHAVAAFQIGNPDCNPTTMQAELMLFLRDVAEADGVLDEREELALDAINAVFREETALSFSKVGRTLVASLDNAGAAMRGVADKLMPNRTSRPVQGQ